MDTFFTLPGQKSSRHKLFDSQFNMCFFMKPQLPWFGYSKEVTDIPAENEISATTKDMAKREVIRLMLQKSGQQQLSSGSF